MMRDGHDSTTRTDGGRSDSDSEATVRGTPSPDPTVATEDTATERTPLLKPLARKPTPLPVGQLFIVLLLRVTEPISYTVCFPFINQMLLDIGVVSDPKKAGFYAGIVESVFAFTELLTVFHWGKISDRIGRKPVLLIGCLFSALSAATFGLSTNFTMLVLTRAINGLANGNVAVLKSVIGELTDESNQARAFSFFPLSLAIGTILASMIGGYLSNITDTFPALGASIPLLRSYPYFLPSFVAALFPLVGGFISLLWMKETLPPPSAEVHEDHEGYGAMDLLKLPEIRPLMVSFTIMSLEAIAYQALLPLFFFTPIADGGLGFTEAQIGAALSLRGLATIAVQLFAFPVLVRRVGNTRLFRILVSLYIPTFLLLPTLNGLARTTKVTAAPVSPTVWIGTGLVLALGAISNMAFACNLIMTNDAVPNRRSLGALNGLAAFFSSCTRVVGPGSANALFALSVDQGVLGGQLIWVFMSVIAVLGWVSSWGLKKQYGKR